MRTVRCRNPEDHTGPREHRSRRPILIRQRRSGRKGSQHHQNVWSRRHFQGTHPHQTFVHMGRHPGGKVTIRSQNADSLKFKTNVDFQDVWRKTMESTATWLCCSPSHRYTLPWPKLFPGIVLNSSSQLCLGRCVCRSWGDSYLAIRRPHLRLVRTEERCQGIRSARRPGFVFHFSPTRKSLISTTIWKLARRPKRDQNLQLLQKVWL